MREKPWFFEDGVLLVRRVMLLGEGGRMKLRPVVKGRGDLRSFMTKSGPRGKMFDRGPCVRSCRNKETL